MTKEQRVRLGMFLSVSAALFIIILAVFIIPKLREEGDVYSINFKDTSVNGLYVGAPVKYQGVEIGKVDRINVNPKDLNSILVQTKLKKGFPVKTDMRATLMYMGITGQKFIELSGGTNEAANLKPHEIIPSSRGLGEKAEDIVSNIDSAVQSINLLLNPENQKKITLVLQNAEKTSQILTDVLERRKENLEQSIANIEDASYKFGEVTENLFVVLDNLRSISARIEQDTQETFSNIADRFSGEEMGQVIKNLEMFTQTVTESIKRIQTILVVQQQEMNQTFENFREVMDNMSKFSRDLAEDPTIFIRSRKEKGK